MNQRLITFNMETHNVKEWAEKLKIDRKYLNNKLNKGESLFDIIRNYRRYNTKKGRCTAKNVNDCFECEFSDCVKNDYIEGELSFLSNVVGV